MRADFPRRLVLSQRIVASIGCTLTAVLMGCGTPLQSAQNPLNKSPIASAGPDLRVGIGQQATLDSAGSSDPDNDPISFLWTQLGGPTVTLSDVHGAKPTFSATVAGTYTFLLTVTDARGASTDDTVVVTLDPSIRADWIAPKEGDTILTTVTNFRIRWSGMSSTSTPHWRLFLNTATGVAVREYTLTPESTGPNEWTANWTPGTGGPVSGGAYQLIMREDLGGISTKVAVTLN